MSFIIGVGVGAFIMLMIVFLIHQRNLPVCTCGEDLGKMCNICSVRGEKGIIINYQNKK